MQIRSMTSAEVEDMLLGNRIGRLACVLNGQPHIAPLSFVHRHGSLYCFSTEGRKIEAMRANPLVCVEFEDICHDRDWSVLLVEGHYQELTEKTDPSSDLAYEFLQGRPAWWEPAYVRTLVGPDDRPLKPVYFRINITKASGRRTVADQSEATEPRASFWARLMKRRKQHEVARPPWFH